MGFISKRPSRLKLVAARFATSSGAFVSVQALDALGQRYFSAPASRRPGLGLYYADQRDPVGMDQNAVCLFDNLEMV
jgi:hypothetical protein